MSNVDPKDMTLLIDGVPVVPLSDTQAATPASINQLRADIQELASLVAFSGEDPEFIARPELQRLRAALYELEAWRAL